MGAEVIGTTSTQDKAQMARASGADHIIVGRDSDIVTEVARLTGGVGVDFAIDGIGGTTLAKTLGCVRRFGLVASIGQAAGPIPSVAVEALGPVRSLSLARPSVMAYATEKASYAAGMAAVIAMLAAGGFAEIGPNMPWPMQASANQPGNRADVGQYHPAPVILCIPKEPMP
jgi:NADPH2:quinone reductase